MSTFDIVVIVILSIGAFKGFRRGLVVSLASLVALVLGIYCAVCFSGFIGEYLYSRFRWPEQPYRTYLSFAIVFVGIVLSLRILAKILTKILDFVALGIINKLLGGCFGILKYLVLISIAMYFYDQLSQYFDFSRSIIDDSTLYPFIISICDFLYDEIEVYTNI